MTEEIIGGVISFETTLVRWQKQCGMEQMCADIPIGHSWIILNGKPRLGRGLGSWRLTTKRSSGKSGRALGNTRRLSKPTPSSYDVEMAHCRSPRADHPRELGGLR